MLTITFQNDKTGDADTGNYDYKVYINQEKISEGRIENHDRNKGWQELIRQVSEQLETEQLKKEEEETFFDNPLDIWFELSYANFLTVPRLVMNSMPYKWRKKMTELLFELDYTFDWRPKDGRYWVSLRGSNGRYAPILLWDYRHGSCEDLRIKNKDIIEEE